MNNVVNIYDYAKYLGIVMIRQSISVSPLKLQKILYYQQAWHMVAFGREKTLFRETPQAWVNGPVYPAIYHQYKEMVGNMCEHLLMSDFVNKDENEDDVLKDLESKMKLTKEELELTHQVILLYGSRSQNQLIYLTHSEKPWSEQREGMLPYERSEKDISLDTMYTYYKERYDRNHNNNA